MAYMEKPVKEVIIKKNINFKEELFKEMKEYISFMGLDDFDENEAISHIVNESVRKTFNQDKDYKKFKKDNNIGKNNGDK